jgi:DNA-directed RNA polymerase subunit RPC12/RpoP
MGAKGTSRIVHLKKGNSDRTFCGLNCEWGTCRKFTSHLELNLVTCHKCWKAWDSPKRIKEAVFRPPYVAIKITCPGCGQEIMVK